MTAPNKIVGIISKINIMQDILVEIMYLKSNMKWIRDEQIAEFLKLVFTLEFRTLI